MLTMHPENGYEKFLTEQAFETGTPISGTFELLPTCNMDCKMCYVRLSPKEMNRIGKPLSVEEWLKIAEGAVDKGMLFLLLTGGEPLLYPDFIPLYEKLRAMGIVVTVNTNGTLIDEAVVAAWKKDMPRRVNISLYGADNETYAKLCNNPKGFDQVMHGISLLKEAGIPVKFNYTLNPDTYPDLERILRIADQLEIPISTATYMFPPERKRGNVEKENGAYRLSPQEVAKAQVEILKYSFGGYANFKDRLQSTWDHMQEKKLSPEEIVYKEPPGGFLCSAGVSNFWVNWKGDLTACGMLQNPKVSVREKGFAGGWEYIQNETKKIMTSSKCFHCRFRGSCLQCAAASQAENGNFGDHVPYLCDVCESYEKELEHVLENIKNGE